MRRDLRIKILCTMALLVCPAMAAAAPAGVIVSLTPSSISLSSGGVVTLTASVSGPANTAVTWGPAGVIPVMGSLPNSNGQSTNTYTAPTQITAKQTVTITATSVADGTQATAIITLIPIAVTVSVTPATVTLYAGQGQQFTAAVSGISVTGVTWSISPKSGAGAINSAGTYTAPGTVSATQTVTVTATSVFETTATGTATITLQPVSVTVTPATASLTSGQTQQFAATVAGSGFVGVNWSISPQMGAIDNTGLYTAPAAITGLSNVTVTATSTADSSKSATAIITLSPFSGLVTLAATPSSLSSGGVSTLQATVTGGANAAVKWSLSPPGVGVLGAGSGPTAAGVSSNTYTAPTLINAKQTVTVTATSMADTTQSASATITLNPVTISVSVTPATATVFAGASQQFAAAVTGTSATGVTWSVGSGAGAIDNTGLYTAPAVVSANQTVTVTATSVFVTTATGSATITLQAVGVTVTPATASLANGQTQQFTATVVGTTNTAVNWSINPQTGAIDGTGFYTAPATTTGLSNITVTAVSVADPTKSATAIITLSQFSANVTLSANPSTLASGGVSNLQALVTGASNTAVKWSINPPGVGVLGAGSGPTAAGISTNTYTAPVLVTAKQTVAVTATSVADNTQTATSNITLNPVAVTVLVTPTPVTLFAGATQQFTATVTGTSVTGVTWSVSSGAGAIDGNGVYTAPAAVSANQTVTVMAASVFEATATGTATITLQAVGVTVTPATASLTISQTQQFTATVVGSTVTDVNWSISPQTGTIDGTGLYTAPSAIAASATITVIAVSVADSTKSAKATVTLQAVGVTVTPATASLTNGQTQQFTATVVGSPNTAVNWSLSPPTGAIDSTGLYTAPATITGPATIAVTATSVADSTKSGKATVALSMFIDVGTGAPTLLMQEEFQAAFYRNGFNSLVSLPPIAAVARLGATGYYQRFYDANKDAGVTYALVTVSPTAPPLSDGTAAPPVVQLYSGLYSYFTQVGVTSAGYPIMDTQNCPTETSGNSCTYDLFDKGYGLFAYATALPAGQNFTVSAGFYTEWTNLGGIAGPGPPVDVTTAITASTGTTATQQVFASGALYTINSGANRAKVFGVLEPIYDLYVSTAGPAGSLGLPTGDAFALASGVRRQYFEGGALEYAPGGTPVVRPPVASVVLSGSAGTNITLSLGSTLTVTATPYTSTGIALPDRAISWSTSNGSAVAIQANGAAAVLQAVGGGMAKVSAVSEGVASAPLTVVVIASCCQVGEGAPATVEQAFQTALARDQVVVQVPVAAPAAKVGNGYAQMLQSANPNAPVAYMLAQGDSLGAAYFVSGALLAYYLAAGGPAGSLGYPIGDASAGGTQLFQNSAALAGNPVRLVSGGVLAKWISLGLDTGAAGPPAAEASSFSTFGANSGAMQSFANGAIYSSASGPLAGQAYFVSGLILTTYTANGGAAGNLGMPAGDEMVSGSVHSQKFEGGSITYSAGATSAQVQAAPKVPGVVAPASIPAGGTAHLAIVGFPNNSTVRVSVTGEPDFLVTTATGAYSWQMFIPLTAASGTVSIHAADTQGASVASGTLGILGFDDNRISIAKVMGDSQNGPPGTLLPLPLTVALRDASGSPVAGAQVMFQGSTGVQLSTSGAVTDSSGQAQTLVRLPNAEGVALVTVNAPAVARNPVTFALTATAASLNNFPALQQSGSATLGNGTATIAQKGALLAAVAAILRYRQNRGDLPNPNGLADPGTLNQFLKSFCVADANGNQICDGFLSNPDSGEQVVNLWRAGSFTGGVDVAVDTAAVAPVADRVAQGAPLLLSLGLTLNGTPMGGHFVVAMGVASDGSIAIQDPNPFFARTNLNDYLNGFAGQGGTWQATLRGVAEFVLRSPGATRFLLAAISQPPGLMANLALSASSAAGPCGNTLDLWDAVDSSGNAAPGAPISRVLVCDGAEAAYQIQVGAAQKFRAFLTDLAPGGTSTDLSGAAPANYQAMRPVLPLVLAPLAASFAAGAVVNGATFTGGIAPGGIISIFGTGLSGPGFTTTVDIDGATAPVLFASAFQVNAQVPASVAAGAHTLHLHSAYGAAQQAVTVSAVAPAIFLVGTPPTGAVTNQDGSLNGPGNPLPRGQVLVIYATGLGAVAKQGPYSVATTPVTVVLNGTEFPAAFAGLTPGFTGLYQVNVVFPTTTPPGSGIFLALKQGGQVGNTVMIALQ